MRVVHVTYPTAQIRRTGQRLTVWVGKEPKEEIRLHGLQQLVISGNVTLTPPAMDLLLRQGVDTVFMTGAGRYRGRLVGHLSGNIQLRLRQFQTLTQASGALKLAKSIVKGKIRNQRVYLRRKGDRTWSEGPLRALRAAEARAELATSLDELRGCEGSASAAYFRVFGHLIRSSELRFDGRTRRPPLDPVNALLSFGYTLLFNLVGAAVERVGLDPYLGALHAPLTGRPSLVCDLVEEFRTPIVDALVVTAINRRAIQAPDFEDVGPGEPVLMKRETSRWFVELFERRVEQAAIYAPLGVRLRQHQIIEQQARALARAFTQGDPYVPYAPR